MPSSVDACQPARAAVSDQTIGLSLHQDAQGGSSLQRDAQGVSSLQRDARSGPQDVVLGS